jgi:hypothetical protein
LLLFVLPVDMAHIEQRYAESGRVADLLLNRQRLLQVAERRLVVAAGVVDLREVDQRGPFARAVADLIDNRQSLLQVAERRLVVAAGWVELREFCEGRRIFFAEPDLE